MEFMIAVRRAVILWAAPVIPISRVWLFGSRAKGEARDDSDIDLAVEIDWRMLDGEFPAAFWMYERQGLREALQPAFACRLDLWQYDPQTDPAVAGFVHQSGVLVYSRAVIKPP